MQDEFLRLQSVLHKTIVFITHDFDEAIRLADRIAIMKDGAVDQIGAPEDLVVRPATPYVAEFTRDVSRAKVLSVGSVMKPLGSQARGDYAGELTADQKVAQVAPLLRAAQQPFAVIDANGALIGELSRDDVIDVLMEG